MPLVFQSLASMDRIEEIFASDPLVKDSPNAKPLRLSGGEIEFQDVDFTYRSLNVKSVFQGLNLKVPAQSSVGIVGASGVGKSTLVQLLLRFRDPEAGKITIDGQDIRNALQKDLRSQIGVVLQETILLSGTVRQNILLGKEDATDTEIWTALEMADAKGFVKETGKGLNAILGPMGVNLSGGQRQRLSIARVFLKNPPIVLFDEATSALDSLAEKQIQKSLKKLLKGRTAIIIAHRISTIMDCDQIVMLDKSGVAAMGTHQELLKESNPYQILVQAQIHSGLPSKKVSSV